MLEIINLKKTYKTKQGVETHALNGVSLKFPETGLVFLLGKSGSGKSTLLNICGGLDSATEGEIIIKERSSKDFSQTDFDSYRNTFVGFIFQEYNILQEFTVEDNIALALELQGKPKDTNAINELLAQVDLEGLGKRKPNTLSGGQKQRIAIARALIKSPEIIMADEPTGALDSNTGKQVFDTLKKLSKDKLIIVVSHDRDFAENYGDRIIELKDGKVISDITKTVEKQEKINNNISIIGEDILCVKDGEDLTEEDFKLVKNFLKRNKNSIICNNQKDVTSIKKAAKINEHGSKETFTNTNENDIKIKKYSKEDSKFIKSKLPLRHAIKIGVSSLKVKPFKLFLTIALCSFAFILFGLLSTMMLYDGEEVFKETLGKSNYTSMKLQKLYQSKDITYREGEEHSYINYIPTRLTKDEYNTFKEQYGPKTFGVVSYQKEISNIAQRPTTTSYYQSTITSIGYLDNDNPIKETINGSYPTNDKEIAISSYIAQSIVENGLTDPTNNKKYTINTIEDVFNKKIKLGNKTYTITGIIPSEELSIELEILKEAGNTDYKLVAQLNNELSEGIHLVGFVTEDELNNIPMSDENIWNLISSAGALTIKTNNEYKPTFQYTTTDIAAAYFDITYFDENNKSLEDNETLFSLSALSSLIDANTSKLSESQLNKYYGYVDKGIATKIYEIINDEVNEKTKETYLKEIIAFLKETKLDNVTITASNNYDGTEISHFNKKIKIVGIYNDNSYNCIMISKELQKEVDAAIKKNYEETGYDFYTSETEYKVPQGIIYDYLYLEFTNNEETISSLSQYAKVNEEDISSYRLSNSLAAEVMSANEMVSSISQVFLYAGIVIAIFAILLLSNFISTSISSKTKEIGILRAVGARSADVFKIFLSETFVIALVCIILSIIGGFVSCSLLNTTVSNITNITLFVFGLPSILILIIVAIITTILATFLPVNKAANKKPVDSIRGA